MLNQKPLEKHSFYVHLLSLDMYSGRVMAGFWKDYGGQDPLNSGYSGFPYFLNPRPQTHELITLNVNAKAKARVPEYMPKPSKRK